MSEPPSAANEEPRPRRGVFVVDDHPLVRAWLVGLIDRQPDLRVCGQATTRVTACEAICALQPDAVVVDFWLEGGFGAELVRRLRSLTPQVPTLVLSMHGDPSHGERALRAGARGYVIDHAATEDIIEAIRQVLRGQVYISGSVAARIAEKYVGRCKPALASASSLLTAREIEVFRRIGLGHKTRFIAEDLHVSLKTIQTHCSRIKEKLGLADGTELILAAVRWVDTEEKG